MKSTKTQPVARLVRARIERGDYPDGHHLVQDRLAAELGVDRSVVWSALAALQDDGLVSRVVIRGQHRYLVNATPASRQVQRLLNWLEHHSKDKAKVIFTATITDTTLAALPGILNPHQPGYHDTVAQPEPIGALARPAVAGLTAHKDLESRPNVQTHAMACIQARTRSAWPAT